MISGRNGLCLASTAINCEAGPEGDLDGLFAVSGHSGATLGILGEMDDPEIYLVLDTPGTVSGR